MLPIKKKSIICYIFYIIEVSLVALNECSLFFIIINIYFKIFFSLYVVDKLDSNCCNHLKFDILGLAFSISLPRL